MNIRYVEAAIYDMFENRPDLLDETISVEVIRIILSEEFDKEVDKRQIGRTLMKMGFLQENKNVSQAPVVRRNSVYYMDSKIYEDAKVKYVVNRKKRDG